VKEEVLLLKIIQETITMVLYAMDLLVVFKVQLGQQAKSAEF
jgi:hypothetical protein